MWVRKCHSSTSGRHRPTLRMIKPVNGTIWSFCHLVTLMPCFTASFMPAFTANRQHRARFCLAALEFHSICALAVDSMGVSWTPCYITVQNVWFCCFLTMAAPLIDALLLCAADYDLTGQLVWPGAILMNHYLSEHSETVNGRSVIELGSGVGERISCHVFFNLWSCKS
jgi:hypothetical protein